MQPRGVSVIISQIALLAFVGSAKAACDQKTVYMALVNRYIFQDTGFMGYDDPVFQGGATLSCDSGWFFDIFNSSGLSTDGSYGNLKERQYADEFDFTVARNAEFSSALGVFQYQIFTSYYMLADFDRSSDDVIEVRAELSRRFQLPDNLMKITIAPYIRTMGFIGLGVFDDSMILRPGMRVTLPLNENISLVTNLATGFDPAAGTEIFRSDTGIEYNFASGVSVYAEWQTAEGVQSAAMIGFSRMF